ncbi:MAG: hypothetical protein JSU01_05865 [Bacteroidetes bacterium]|nr:hypothetical protein [Bacteroidota bacterium]
MRNIKIASMSLGMISLAFGTLKFISPFKDWYAAQIKTSGLPTAAYSLGMAGEIVVGIAFLFPFFVGIGDKRKRVLLILASILFSIMMISAAIVHLVPGVPADVLPLKIKPPVIPLFFLCVAIFNLVQIIKTKQI